MASYPISSQADFMAKEIRNNTHTGKRIGDVLNQVERDHYAAEKQRANDRTGTRQLDAVAARYTNSPRISREAYQPVAFDRDAARTQLVALYPWLSPGHPENPDQIFHSYMARRATAQHEALRTAGDIETVNNYRASGTPTKSYGSER